MRSNDRMMANVTNGNDVMNEDEDLQSGETSEIVQIGFIDPKSNICASCNDADAMKCAIGCFLCKQYFHATCRNANGDRKGKEIICKRSFFNTYSSMIESGTALSSC